MFMIQDGFEHITKAANSTDGDQVNQRPQHVMTNHSPEVQIWFYMVLKRHLISEVVTRRTIHDTMV